MMYLVLGGNVLGAGKGSFGCWFRAFRGVGNGVVCKCGTRMVRLLHGFAWAEVEIDARSSVCLSL
jgi:hypothetical protein